MKGEGIINYAMAAIVAVAAVALQPAHAVPVTLNSNLVYDGVALSDDISAPHLGSTGFGVTDYVVFQVNKIGPFGTGPGSIFLQRLDNAGGAVGIPVVISNGTTNDTDPDASGDFVVHTIDRDSDGVGDGVRLYDVSTNNEFFITNSAFSVSDARVSQGGDQIIWNDNNQTTIFAQRISSVGTGTPPTTVRGPIPVSTDPEVGSRYIVWSEQHSGGEKETRAQEIFGSSFFVTPGDTSDGFDEILPATSRNSIAFGLEDRSTGLADIILRDVLADTTTSFSLGLEGLSSLSLAEDFIAFNALDGGGVMQAFVLSLLDGGLLQLTSSPEGSSDINILGNMVTYTSGERLYVASLADEVAVVPLPPAVLLFGAGIACLAGLARRCSKQNA